MDFRHVILILFGLASTANADLNITSPPLTNWGSWGRFDRCPVGKYAQGFQLRTQQHQLLGDDTALNTIRLFCGDPNKQDTVLITSSQGNYGTWGSVFTCFPGFLNGFQMRTDMPRGSGDDTAANNIRFFCDNAVGDLEGDGLHFGSWTQSQNCLKDQAICGIQTQVHFKQSEDEDDTALNNVLMECCDLLGHNAR